MKTNKRILIITDDDYNPNKILNYPEYRYSKGYAKLGHHILVFNYSMVLKSFNPFKSKTIGAKLYKKKVDQLLIKNMKSYQPDIVIMFFPRDLNYESISLMRENWPDAVFIGHDGDAWPKLQKSPRIETAKGLDILTATNNGIYLDDYRQAGVPLCAFMPNAVDPDLEHRYVVSEKWQSDILWVGKTKHSADSSDTLREELVQKLSTMKNCAIYGCENYPKIGTLDYIYSICGAKIGVHVNAINSVKLYHSDRLSHYLACGTFVLSKRVPDTDLLFEDKVHIRYFDSIDEFFDLADYYLKHEEERKQIADAGMNRAHKEYNCEKIAQYYLELIENGSYNAPWF
ncbi:MAG: glycosyltransferase [Sedimentisphaerales bacterium]|nr:glycosyltransferase [Sedimentisphaerales bacterium]